MATINTKQIPELDPVGIFLDDTDEFVVFDNRENALGNSKARRVSYGELKDSFVNPEMEIVGGIKYNFQDEDTTLHITNDKIILEPATQEKAGYMSAQDKQDFDNIKQTDVGKLATGFNTKVRATSTSPTETATINTIQGDGVVTTAVVTDEEQKILHIAFDRNKLISDSRTKVTYNGSEKNLDYLTFDDNGLIITQTTSADQKNTYKIGLDTDRIVDSISIDASIKADIGEEEKSFSKIVPGQNIAFSETEDGNLTITSLGSSSEEDPVKPIEPIANKNKIYICDIARTDVHKVISADPIEQGEIFTVYFSDTFAGDSSGEDYVYLRFGQEIEKPIYYNNSIFSLAVINRYATFIKEANCYSLLSTDTSIGKAVRTSVEYTNGTENLVLYDGTQYSFVNNLNQTSVVQLNNNQKIDNNYLDIFDNGKIRPALLPTSGGEGGGSSSTVGWPVGYASTIDSDNTYTVDLPSYVLSEGNLVAVKFQEAPLLRYFNLNINNTGARPVSYHGSTNFNNTVFDNADIALFIYDGSSYVLLSIDAVVGDSINISTEGHLTSISPRKEISSITLLNNNLLDNNNTIKEQYLPDFEDYLEKEEILTNSGTIKTEILPIEVGTGLNINTDSYQGIISINLNLPDEETNPAGLFLNGSGYWSQVPTLKMLDDNNQYRSIESISSNSLELNVSGSNLGIEYTNNIVFNDLIPMLYPVGSVYQNQFIEGSTFNPNMSYFPGYPDDNWGSNDFYIFSLAKNQCPNLGTGSGQALLTQDEIFNTTLIAPTAYWDLISYSNGILTWVKKALNSSTDGAKITKIIDYRRWQNSNQAG